MLSGSTIDTFEARAERVTLNHAISVVSNLLGKDLYMLLIARQTALSLFTYTHMKFLSFLTQRLSFCSTNVVKVQVSSILKGKKFRCDKRFEPGVPDRQSSSLSIKPLEHRGFAASGWFDLSTISKTRLTLTPANQYIFSAESYNQYLLCVRITTYPRAV